MECDLHGVAGGLNYALALTGLDFLGALRLSRPRPWEAEA